MIATVRTSWICLTALALVWASTAVSEAASPKVIQPFNGKDLSGWTMRRPQGTKWVVGIAKLDSSNPSKLVVAKAEAGDGELVNSETHSVDILTDQKFGDCTISLEVMVPKGSNSGIYLVGNYEIQILDSFGR